MKKSIFLEGGGESWGLNAKCREGFRKLLEKCGFKGGRMPRLFACGSRNETFAHFRIALDSSDTKDFVAMLIDSEEPVAKLEATWAHLKTRDKSWKKPNGVTDEHVLFMTTCMETWIAADRATLKLRYGKKLQVSALPPLTDLEKRHRHDVQDRLERATRDCLNAYAKGKRSFELLGKLEPDALKQLPSFARVLRILNARL